MVTRKRRPSSSEKAENGASMSPVSDQRRTRSQRRNAVAHEPDMVQVAGDSSRQPKCRRSARKRLRFPSSGDKKPACKCPRMDLNDMELNSRNENMLDHELRETISSDPENPVFPVENAEQADLHELNDEILNSAPVGETANDRTDIARLTSETQQGTYEGILRSPQEHLSQDSVHDLSMPDLSAEKGHKSSSCIGTPLFSMPTPDPPALIRMDASLSEDRSGKLRYVKPLNQLHIMNRPNLLRLLESQPQPLQNVASKGMPSGGDESKVEIRSSPKMMDFVAESLQTLSEGEGLRQRHINVTPIVKNDLNTPLTESGPLVLPSHSRMKNPVCDSMGTGDNEESLGEDDFLSTTSSLESQSKDIRGDRIVTQDVMKDSGAGSQEGVLLPEDIPPSSDNNRQACSKEDACLMTKDLGRDPEMSPSHETDDTNSEESKRYREEGAANRSLARQPVPTASISSSGISSPTISPKETYEMFAAPSSRSIHLGKPFLDHKLSGLPCGIDAVKRQSQLNVDFAKTSASVTVLGSTQLDNLCEISSHKSRCRRYKNNRSSKRPGTSVVEEEPVEVDAFGNYYGKSVLFPYHPKDLHLIDYNPILRGSVYGARETTYPDYLYSQAHAKDIEGMCCAGYQDPSVDSSGFSQSRLQGVLSDYQYMLESSRSFLANASGDTCSVEKHRLSPGQEADIQDALRIIIGSNHIPPTLDAAEVLANYGSMILNNETIRQEFIMFCEQLVVKQMLCGQSEHGQGDSWLLNGNSQSGLFSSGLYQQWYPHNPALYFDGDAFVSIGVSMDSHGNLCLLLPEDHPDRRGLPDSVSVYSTPDIAALCV